MLFAAGCAQQQNVPEYSVEIVDATKTAAQTTVTETEPQTTTAETVRSTAETVTTAAESTATVQTTAPASAAKTTKTAKTTKKTTASGYQLTEPLTETTTVVTTAVLNPDGSYTTKEDVSLYLYTYHKLPGNFISKKQAQDLGWNGGSLEPYAPGCCIGGTVFGNYEGRLPKKKGRTYYECDIDTRGASSRGAKRIVYSDDGLIYYTEDHYNTFQLLYGEES
ncbi:MAG: ribonuclease [Oscillospiraceae bacterium]|nr:ribonuclease [Oscillospiraceae bacterium]